MAFMLLIITLGLLFHSEKQHQNVIGAITETNSMIAAVSEEANSVASDIKAFISENVSKIVAPVVEENNSVPETDQTLSYNDLDISLYSSNARFKIGEEVPLPSLPTEPKHFTDYRFYNLWYTPHYRLQQSAYTDKDGLRRFNDDYIVAMGKFYSEDIGDRFHVTLDTGVEFTVILGDGKHPSDCDINNMYAPCMNYADEDCANLLEFIVDDSIMSADVYAYGSIDCIDKFKGNIVKMVYLGRDNSANWDIYETR